MKSFAFAKNLNLKRLLQIAVVVLATSLQGCAAGLGGAYEHGIGYCNMGNKTLVYRHLEYGKLIWLKEDTNPHIGGDKNCLGGSVFVGEMPIPVTMTVEWQTSDGPRHKVVVPVRSLVTNKHPARRFQVRFNDEHVQVVQVYFNVRQPYLDASTVIFEQ